MNIDPTLLNALLLAVIGIFLRYAIKYIQSQDNPIVPTLLGSKSSGENTNGIKTMAQLLIDLQNDVNKCKEESDNAIKEVESLRKKDEARDELWSRVVENNTAALDKYAEFHRQNIELQKSVIEKLDTIINTVTETLEHTIRELQVTQEKFNKKGTSEVKVAPSAIDINKP